MKHQFWWKKFVTTVQLVQFVVAGIHASHLLFNPYCDYPRPISFLELCESVFFFYTFSKFYKKNYIDKNNNDNKVKQG